MTAGAGRGQHMGSRKPARKPPDLPAWRGRGGTPTRAVPSLRDIRDALRRASGRIWSATSVRDLLAVAADLEALSNAVATTARRRMRLRR
jgi:hypothetical protein